MTHTPPIAAAATVLLHAVLIAAVVNGLAVDSEPEPNREPMQVQLIAPAPDPMPAVQPAPKPPPPAPQPPKKERRAPRPQAAPPPAPSVNATAPLHTPETRTEAPAPPSAPAAAPAPAPAPALPAVPAPPARTSASEASYASTNRIPPYPRASTINGDEGTVVLRVLVTPEGTAGAVEIRSSSGHALLDESARRTVQTWRFKPATVDGKPVAEWYQVPIPFKLRNN